MFSGLVEAKSPILSVHQEEGGVRLKVRRPEAFTDLAIGDSVALNGCCLTVVAFDEQAMEFQAGEETLAKTSLGKISVQAENLPSVNCERAVALGDRMGGHLVTGHVDGLGRVSQRIEDAEWCNMAFECDFRLLRQMAAKGSITVDGVSLTLVDVTDSMFSVALIPHTLQETTLGALQVGESVNLETDLLAKYVQRQLETQPTESGSK